jgi:hypothetical protein
MGSIGATGVTGNHRYMYWLYGAFVSSLVQCSVYTCPEIHYCYHVNNYSCDSDYIAYVRPATIIVTNWGGCKRIGPYCHQLNMTPLQYHGSQRGEDIGFVHRIYSIYANVGTKQSRLLCLSKVLTQSVFLQFCPSQKSAPFLYKDTPIHGRQRALRWLIAFTGSSYPPT